MVEYATSFQEKWHFTTRMAVRFSWICRIASRYSVDGEHICKDVFKSIQFLVQHQDSKTTVAENMATWRKNADLHVIAKVSHHQARSLILVMLDTLA